MEHEIDPCPFMVIFGNSQADFIAFVSFFVRINLLYT